MDTDQNCPYVPSDAGPRARDWWPQQLDLDALHANPPQADPMGADFDYGAAFDELDLADVTADLTALMTDSQPWWPADYGHYGPLFVRMAWHSAGTYRISDGRGGGGAGLQRFAPLNSWPDNVNLDKARRLLWPIKRKYGRRLSWADLIILAGNVALESMGLRTFGFGGGRPDVYEPDDTYWGPERTWLADERYQGDRELENPLAAVQMGLIYVNPEGPNGEPSALAAARDIRETFARMAMDDEETVALIAGGHTFGKTHGAATPVGHVGPEPEAAPLQQMGLGWANSYGAGSGDDTIGSGLEGAWTPTPITWDNSFFETLFGYDWDLVRSPAGAYQWIPTDPDAATTVPDPHDPAKRHAPIMLTTDLALRMDPAYQRISRRFLEHPEQFADAFARAWFKLTHRDMGPVVRYRGALVPAEPLIWQDPVPAVDHELVGPVEIADLKRRVLDAGVPTADLVFTAWASAATFRGTDKRGGSDGARVRLAPQKDWPVNDPPRLARTLAALDEVRSTFNASRSDAVRVSQADLIVLAGCAAVEAAALAGGVDVVVPFRPGRTDATAEMTDARTFDVLEPTFDGFRNHVEGAPDVPAEHLLVERAARLTLTAPQTAVLVGGLRVLGANSGARPHGVFTDRPGALTNDFFTAIVDMGTVWEPVDDTEQEFTGRDRDSGEQRWQATRVDLAFGANSQLRALSEVYAADDGSGLFVRDFVAAWAKVMDLGRYDLR